MRGKGFFDIFFNGDIAFQGVDVLSMSGNILTAFVLNKTVAVNGRALTVSLRPRKGYAMISAVEIFEVIVSESETLSSEVEALQKLKSGLGLPLRLGWNGDPCTPQQHPWVGVDCQFDRNNSKWVIDGIGLANQGLRSFLPNDISNLSHLQNINLSGNSIRGAIPTLIGTLTRLKILDLSYNLFNGSIPESLGQLSSIQILNLNGNSLTGRVPPELGGRLLHRASFNFTGNDGLCGIPGLPSCGARLSVAAKFGIAFVSLIALFLFLSAVFIWWKRNQNILRAQQMAARAAPYAKKKTHFSHELHLTRHHGNVHARLATENGPILLA